MDTDAEVTVAGEDAPFLPRNDVIDFTPFAGGGERTGRNPSFVVLRDTAGTYWTTVFSSGWYGKRLDTWMRSDGGLLRLNSGWLRSRTPGRGDGGGAILTLAFDGLFGLRNTQRKLFTNGQSQRERAIAITGNASFVDTCADAAQDEIDANWGGNG